MKEATKQIADSRTNVKFTEKQLLAFWRKVQRDERTNCWRWIGYRNVRGYGRFRACGWIWYAHRFAWILTHPAPIPEGMDVCHRCDNPKCVNPRHLYLGTHQDNMRDKKERHRASRLIGSKNPGAKLTVAQVKLIRAMYIPRHGAFTALSKHFSVSRQAITRIIYRTHWQNVK